ncbi:MAG: hypothetical protein ACT4QD_21115, partial [Acidobacteriota bacterium]
VSPGSTVSRRMALAVETAGTVRGGRPYHGAMQAFGMLAALAVLAGQVGVAQSKPAAERLVAALEPALPFPAADAAGEVPSDNSTTPKWFVVWPRADDEPSVVVKANPLNEVTQASGAAAMEQIQIAVVEAERKAQAAYDRALDELRRTGKATNLDGITLEDEGVAGERIDAELELTIAWHGSVESFEIASSETPIVEAGTGPVAWILRIMPNVYRPTTGADQREHFRAAEARLYLGPLRKPAVAAKPAAGPVFAVTVLPAPGASTVVLRGNDLLLAQVLTAADWTQLGTR